MTEYKKDEFQIDVIKPSVRFACFTKDKYYDVVLQVGSNIHIKLLGETELKGKLDSIYVDTDGDVVSLAIDTEEAYFSDIDTNTIETIFPFDCDNCADCPIPDREEAGESIIRITTRTGWHYTKTLNISRESIKRLEVL